MSELRYIRTKVFGASQRDFATVGGVDQGTVSRWERDEREPSYGSLRRIRSEAMRRGIPWDDRWFFELPREAQAS